MARGFESKMVEFQQEEAARAQAQKKAPLTPEDRARAEKRQAILLARTRAAADLVRATVPAHKRMLEKALEALDEQLRSLS